MYSWTVGNHTDRIKNMFLVYAAGLRALSIANDLIKDYDYKTGLDKLQDAETVKLMDELLQYASRQC